MNKLKLGIVFSFFLLVQTSYGQRWGLDPFLSFLKEERDINIEFSYDSMTVTSSMGPVLFGSIYASGLETNLEADFVKIKKEKFNQQTAGKGDKWADEWYQARQLYFEPIFEVGFKAKMQKMGINADRKNRGARYTLIVKTTDMFFGRIDVPNYAMGNSRSTKVGTFCDYYLTFVETKNHSKVLARATAKLVYGRHVPVFKINSYKAALVADCYEKAGKYFGKSVVKALSK